MLVLLVPGVHMGAGDGGSAPAVAPSMMLTGMGQ